MNASVLQQWLFVVAVCFASTVTCTQSSEALKNGLLHTQFTAATQAHLFLLLLRYGIEQSDMHVSSNHHLSRAAQHLHAQIRHQLTTSLSPTYPPLPNFNPSFSAPCRSNQDSFFETWVSRSMGARSRPPPLLLPCPARSPPRAMLASLR